MDRIVSCLLGFLIVFGAVAPVAAVSVPTVLFVGPSRIVRTDDQVAIEIQLDSASQQINAAELHIGYQPDRLRVIRVGREQSIFPVWPEEPSWDANLGVIKLVGGRPKGIIASRATVATVYFTVLRSGLTDVTLLTPSSRVFRHDGQGTPVDLPPVILSITVADPLVGGLVLRSATHPTIDSWSRNGTIDVNWDIESDTLYSYALSQDRLAVPDDIPDQLVVRATYSGLADGIYYFTIKSRASGQDWSEVTQRRFLLDRTPPEPFTLETFAASAVPDRTLISWLAVDRTSGVENYRLLIAGRDQGVVTSPLSFKSAWAGQSLSIIATDAAGNRRTAKLDVAATGFFPSVIMAAVAGGLAVCGGVIWLGLRMRRRIA